MLRKTTERFFGAASRFGLLLPIFVLGVTPCLGVDGVLEINQACAEVGCFPNDMIVNLGNDGTQSSAGDGSVSGTTAC